MKAPTRPKTAAQLLRQTKEAARGKWLTLHKWRAVRKSLTTSTGWSTKQYDAWFAAKVEAGTFQVAPSNPAAGTAFKRETAMAMVQEGAAANKYKVMNRVKRWLQKRLQGTKVTAPMVRQMEANLTQKGEQRKMIAAAVILLAAQSGMTVEDRRQGVGGSERSWAHESIAWAKEAGWMKAHPRQTNKAEAAALAAVTEHPTHEESVCIELGSGWEGATRGLRQVFDRVVTVDCSRQTIKRGQKANPDILTEFQKTRHSKGGLVTYVATKAGVRKGELKAVWVSPDCTEETVANAINKGKPWAKGFYAGKKRSQEAQEALDTIVEGLSKAIAANPRLQICLENPAVTALSRERSITDRWGTGELVHGCAYGAPTKKTYRLWMTPATRERFTRVRVRPESKQSMCAACKANPKKKHARTVLPALGTDTPRTCITGFTVQAARNMVPEAMAKQVGRCMLQAYDA